MPGRVAGCAVAAVADAAGGGAAALRDAASGVCAPCTDAAVIDAEQRRVDACTGDG
eukprot:gene15622-30017_t